MANICEIENCKNKAFFGYTNMSFERCREHKENRPNANKICLCGKSQPHFAEPGIKTATRCFSCKTGTMKDVRSKMCEVCNEKQPGYAEPGEKTPRRCGSCKTDTMKNIIHRMCEVCYEKQACFAEPGEKTARRCLSCKTNTMKNKHSKMCEVCNEKTPSFAEPGEKTPRRCASCKTNTMKNKHSKMCEVCNEKTPIFAEPGEKTAICCFACKTDTMENVKSKMCLIENCGTRALIKYRGHCARCFKHYYPDDPLSKAARTNTKEITVIKYLNKHFEGFICDKQMSTAHCDCTIRRRPDARKIIVATNLCIEVDENQHKSYSQMNEEMRYNDLFMAYSGKWVYIRFNPDNYKVNGINVKKPLCERLRILKTEIKKQIKRIENGENTELLETVYLYYDS